MKSIKKMLMGIAVILFGFSIAAGASDGGDFFIWAGLFISGIGLFRHGLGIILRKMIRIN